MAGGDKSDQNIGDGETKLDPSNPYFIGSYDGSGNMIVFRGDNYEEWCRFIRLSLMAHRKYELIEGLMKKID